MQDKNKKIGVEVYNLTPEEILEKFGTSVEGLSETEAKVRLEKFGKNKIEKRHTWKWLRLVLNQFKDALVWILLVAAALAYFFGETRDVTIILIIVLINALIGFLQEFKAERILESIRKFTTDKALVIRGGAKKEIDSKLVVPGDIVFVTAGDNVPADGYLLESYVLRVNSFVFTGESRPKTKSVKIINEENVALADIDNMVFMGETIATGEAKFVVTGTGMNTQLGKIAHLTQKVRDDLTPMQKQIRRLGKDVTIISVIIAAIVMIAGQYFKLSLYENFIFALALAVSVVPEGLPAAISVALSLGMKRLLKDNVLAKKLNAVETLGSVSIICTDKTGTITKNELTVTKIFINGEVISITGSGYEPKGYFHRNGEIISPEEIKNADLLFKIGTLCNGASLIKKDNTYKIIGDPTEGAIIVAGKKYNSKDGFYEFGERKVTEMPFSSERMRMSVVYENAGGAFSYIKGSPDILLNLCTCISINGATQKITEEDRKLIRDTYNSMSSQALRVLAFAYKELSADRADNADEAEKDLVWVGMMAMIDPPRPDVAKAIQECKNLGMKVIMITGDYEITARAIAEEVGLLTADNKRPTTNNENYVINGKILDKLEDKEVYQKIKNGACVFARIAPEQKLRIASILKENGEVIAMTGDGVNDAPALKRADIGVAMGIIGTDVSKEAADMILMDDDFASIVKGVKEGRTIYANLKKFVHYVFSSNASELFTVIFGVLLQIPSPIAAIQILAVDLGTDVFPSFALGLEPAEPNQRAGRKKNVASSKQKVISFKGFERILYLGVIMATGAVVAFIWSMTRGGWYFGEKFVVTSALYIKSTTAAYAVLSMTQMANLLQSRSEKFTPFKLGFFRNKYAIGAIFVSVGILLAFMYLPFCQKYLHMLPVDGNDWLVVAVTAILVFLFEEARKTEEK